MTQLHVFRRGDRILLLFPSVGTRHAGTVIQAWPASVSIQIDGLEAPKRFFLSYKGRWRSEIGHMVAVDRISDVPTHPV